MFWRLRTNGGVGWTSAKFVGEKYWHPDEKYIPVEAVNFTYKDPKGACGVSRFLSPKGL